MSEWRVSISDSVTGNVASGTWGGERGDFTEFQATYEARGHPWAQSGSWSLWPNALSWAKCWGVGQTRLRRQGASPGRWERAGCGTQEGAREQTWRQWSAGHQTGRWAETPWGWDDATVTHWLQGPQQITKSLDTQFSSVPLGPHGLQHARPPCPSPMPGAHSHSCPLSRWCHPTISSFVIPFSSHLQTFPASGSFQMSQLFASGGQSIGVSASTVNFPNWFPLGWTGWISLQSKGLSRVSFNTTVQKHQFFSALLSL